MGRHSRGSGAAPAPLPAPPARHPYAPRSLEDSGDRDRQTYRVVDVGLPPGAAEPARYGGRPSAPRDSRPSDPRGLPAPGAAGGSGFRAPDGFGADRGEPRFGATRADLADSRPGAGQSRPPAPTIESRFAGPASESRPAAPTSESRRGGPTSGSRFAGPASESRLGGSPSGSGFAGPVGESRLGAPTTASGFAGPAGESRPAAPTGESRLAAPTGESRLGGSSSGSGFAGPASESGLGGPTGESRLDGRHGDGGESRSRASTAGPAEPPFRGGEPRFGATRADLVEPRFGGSLVDSGESRLHAPVTEPGESRFGGSRFGGSRFGGSRFGADESRLPPPPAPGPAPVRPERPEPRFGATRADLLDPQLTRRDGPAEPRVDLGEPHPGRRADAAEPRFGATRVDLAESVGSTALAPRPAADPDEVTDTGARRARSAFRLASEDDEDETDEAEHDEPEDEHDDHEHEPALLVQWAIFVAQTLTGAVAGIGVWLGFYRLWSTWPFYAVPAVGVGAIAMLVLARILRRRHGRDLDLLTAVVTAVVITVLTVLPAAFTLQGLTQ